MNKKLLIWITFLILISLNIHGQKAEIYVVYEKMNADGRIINFDVRIFEDYSTYTAQMKKRNNSNEIILTASGKYIFEKIKKDNKLYYSESIMNKRFYIIDSLHPMKWQISKELKTILGYPCQMAKTHFRGRDYVAYFSKKIPVDNGPYKFGGLPGLILEVNSKDGEIKFKANAVTLSTRTNTPPSNYSNYKDKYITYQEYKSIYLDTWKSILQKMKSRSENPNPGDEDYFKSNEIEIIYPELQLGKGINLND